MQRACQIREKSAIDSQSEDPRSLGEALKGSQLGEFWKYRVGDYRIIACIEDGALRVLVLRLGNRKEVYRN
jgi:mRNA interferase RelE/StbE